MRRLRAVVGSNPCALSKNIVAPSRKITCARRSLFLIFAHKTAPRTVFFRSPRNQRKGHLKVSFFRWLRLYVYVRYNLRGYETDTGEASFGG